MNAVRNDPFDNLPRNAATHFQLYFYATIHRLIEQCVPQFGSLEAAFEHFPFLLGYYNELAAKGLDRLSAYEASEWWAHSLEDWEEGVAEHLPLRALKTACELDHETLLLLICIGLIEEDARIGLLFEALQGIPGRHRPTSGLLSGWWLPPDDGINVRAALRRLQELGLTQVVNPEAPRVEWALQPPPLLWDALRGESHTTLAPWANYHPPESLLSTDELILPEPLRRTLRLLPQLLANGETEAVIVRGPSRNGRRTLLCALARSMGRGALVIDGLGKRADERLPLVGPLSTALNALPVLVLDLEPGETAELPRLKGYDGLVGIVMDRQGGVSGPNVERAVTLRLEIPDVEARRLHWQSCFAAQEVAELDRICERFRMTGGNIRRAAKLAQSYAALDARTCVVPEDVQHACRALNRQALDTLAAHLKTTGDWSDLAVSAETLGELRTLESRCCFRERLQRSVSPVLGRQLNAGVRALFSGPSGTGKTLAAKLLAATLQMDLYRLDLSSVVNKYIGETEKSLNRIFARAEELDVILLLDEGDALLTQRTNVQTSNDRYANLETNYLLQRLETFEGILIITTNAGDRIDTAFQRRMDVVVNFRAPEAAERWAIWQLHLGEASVVDPAVLRELAVRCALTGGQIRNAVLHASVLALGNGGVVDNKHLEMAVRREYRKMGDVCPLRS
jgi:ATPase family associated with various cellular activities (AAA)